MDASEIRYMISVLTPDRPGIIADASAAVFGLGGNIEAMSQTIMLGWFTMLMRAAFPAEVTGDAVADAVRAAGHASVAVCPAAWGAETRVASGEPYVMTVIGADKPGIIHAVSRCCADKGVNIDDVWNEVRENRFITIFHVTVPRDVDAADFRHDLEREAETIGVAAQLQHQDIFTATNSLQVFTRHHDASARSI